MNNTNNKVFPNHNVYILGAGFSVDAGLPVIANFLNRMRDSIDWLIEQKWEREREAVEKVFKFRLQAAGAAYRIGLDVENIEELFSLASASEGDAQAGSIKSEQLSNAIAATLEFAQATVQKTPTVKLHIMNKPIAEYPESWRNSVKSSSVANDKVEVIAPTYHVYAGILGGQYCAKSPQQQNTIITFNYDTLLEDALHDQQIKFTYGLSTRVGKEIDFDLSAKCITESGQDLDALPVLKLHGSVNWGTKGSREKLKVFGNYMELRQTNYDPVLVPPTWRKVFGGALNQVWEHARRAISEATRIVIIGFSIPPTDTHFKYLLAAGLRNNISLRQIYFINPDDNLQESVFKIFRPELEARGIIQVQPKIAVNSELRARYTSELFYKGTQNLINRPLSENYFLDSFESIKGQVISISNASMDAWV